MTVGRGTRLSWPFFCALIITHSTSITPPTNEPKVEKITTFGRKPHNRNEPKVEKITTFGRKPRNRNEPKVEKITTFGRKPLV